RALCFCARGLPWLPGDLASATVAAHATDVGDECYLRYLARRLDRDSGRTIQHRQHHSWFHRGSLLDDKRRRWFRDHRPHVEDVQAQRAREKRLATDLTDANLLHRTKLPARVNLLHPRIKGDESP